MKSNIRANQKNAVITLVSTQTVDDSTESATLTADAVYQYDPKRSLISFSQLDPSDKEGVGIQNTLITVLEDNIVTVYRTGTVESEFVIRVGQTHPSGYTTPMGTLDLEFYGLAVESALAPSGGRLFLRYAINIGGAAVSTNTIDLKITLK